MMSFDLTGRGRSLCALLAGVAFAMGCSGRDGSVDGDPAPGAEASDQSLRRELDVAIATASLTSAQTAAYRALKPVLKCVEKVAGTTNYKAHFGYQNSGTAAVSIPVGFNNRFFPNPSGRGQPTTFAPGSQADVVQTTFAGNGLATWILGFNLQTATARSALCPTSSGTGGAGGSGGAGGAGGKGGTGAGGAPAQCPSTCDDHNPCTIDLCSATTSFKCSNVAAANGTACSDGNACTSGDVCQAGACLPGAARTCVAVDACHLAGTCDPVSGACSAPNAPSGTPCDDRNACTLVDACQAGLCVGGNVKTCAATDACHRAGVCQAATGACTNPTQPDGTTCDDGLMCTTGDACLAGLCTPMATLTPTHCTGGAVCDACTSDNCITGIAGCDDFPDPLDRQLCENAYACFINPSSHCVTAGDPLVCWCGTNPDTCATDNTGATTANGPCRAQVLAAAKSTDAATVNERLIDPDYPLGRAVNLIECRGSFCQAECSVF